MFSKGENAARAVIAAIILLLPLHSQAQRSYSPRDMALLPSWCKYTQDFRDKVPGGNNPAEIKRWMERTQGVFSALHHYCWGLMLVNEAKLFSRDPQVRANRFGNSLKEFDYVIERSPPDFVLLPEIYTKKGESLVALGKGPQAVLEFERAIMLKADYWPAYGELSDYYAASGNPGKAREVIERGLLASPGAAPLKERLAQLEAGPRKPPGK